MRGAHHTYIQIHAENVSSWPELRHPRLATTQKLKLLKARRDDGRLSLRCRRGGAIES
jgi:hypothetical protein